MAEVTRLLCQALRLICEELREAEGKNAALEEKCARYRAELAKLVGLQAKVGGDIGDSMPEGRVEGPGLVTPQRCAAGGPRVGEALPVTPPPLSCVAAGACRPSSACCTTEVAGSCGSLGKSTAANLDPQGFPTPRRLTLEEANVLIAGSQGPATKSQSPIAGLTADSVAVQTKLVGAHFTRSPTPAVVAEAVSPVSPQTVGGQRLQLALGSREG